MLEPNMTNLALTVAIIKEGLKLDIFAKTCVG